jgi:hypothetical protein
MKLELLLNTDVSPNVILQFLDLLLIWSSDSQLSIFVIFLRLIRPLAIVVDAHLHRRPS